MAIRVLAVGTRMPGWVTQGVDEYRVRMPRGSEVDWIEVPPAKRQGEAPEKLKAKEAEALRRQLRPGDRVVALDVAGKLVSTEDIAARIGEWQLEGSGTTLLIGGPDGLDPDLLQEVDARWSLGRITLPHPLVRVVLSEQLYRAWSINANHPYHRA